MTITVKNNCRGDIQVAINHWGSKGETGFYTIHSGQTEHWDREDGRGFIMRVKTFGNVQWDLPYYIYADSSITVEDTDWSKGQYVAENGRRLNTAGQGGYYG